MNSPKTPRKIVRFGIEFELFTLDENGYMTNGADRLINRVKKEYPNIEIKRECGKNMIEIITRPEVDVPDAMRKAIEDFERVALAAREEKMVLYAYGTYPGAFTPEFHSEKRYQEKERLLGKQRFTIAGRCVGLHIHYSLPWGVFDTAAKILKPLVNSKNKQSVVNIYNFCIAMDPAVTAFAQSSPFYQGERLGKDARVIVYRGGPELDYPGGLYANLPLFGALQGYQSTNTDILHLISERFEDWSKLLKKLGRRVLAPSKHSSILDNTWNPVKVNAHGTMEIRGMDMNHPDIVVALATVIKYVIIAIQEKFLEVVPSEIALKEPFKIEDKKIYIPPDTHVRFVLQRQSAYEGLENGDIKRYAEGFLALAKKYVPESDALLLKPLEDMLANNATAADRIIAEAREFVNDEGKLTPAQAAKLALLLSRDLYDEIAITKNSLAHHLSGTT